MIASNAYLDGLPDTEEVTVKVDPPTVLVLTTVTTEFDDWLAADDTSLDADDGSLDADVSLDVGCVVDDVSDFVMGVAEVLAGRLKVAD